MSLVPSAIMDLLLDSRTLDNSQRIAISILVSYFVIILALFGVIGGSLRPSFKQYQARKERRGYRVPIFAFLTVGSLVHTWYYMFKYMEWSFHDFENINPPNSATSTLVARVADWLQNTSLFEQAWSIVCSSDSGWWWSQQICLYVVAGWITFLTIQGNRYQIKYLAAYMLLGQFVAISVASNLFYLAIALSPVNPPPVSASGTRAPKRLWLSVLLGLFTVGYSPKTSFTDNTFAINLAVMHICLFIPLLFQKSINGGPHSISIADFASFMSTGTLLLRSLHLYKMMPELFSWQHLDTLHSHPAQSSIGYDVVWTGISYLVWIALDEGRKVEPFTLLRMVIFDVNVLGVGNMASDLVQARVD
ncbi:hypothetical protein DL96DRAFT_1811929 [Flagelloscypha sp. PMI_526]|nr:hypothetical protein DL96DRAFT_1811929 [Flagelloscypha sp. PMI_526]